jgi:hypothetical protein
MALVHPFHFDLDHTKFHARPIEASDKEKFMQAFDKLSTQSNYLRFFTSKKNLSEEQLKYLTELDGVNHIAWIIIDTKGIEAKGVAVGRIIRMKGEPSTAEVAITVIDEYQQMGIGAILLCILNIVASQNDINVFRYYVLHENKFVIEILKELGTLKQSSETNAVQIDSFVRASSAKIPNIPSLGAFKKTMKRIEALIF